MLWPDYVARWKVKALTLPGCILQARGISAPNFFFFRFMFNSTFYTSLYLLICSIYLNFMTSYCQMHDNWLHYITVDSLVKRPTTTLLIGTKYSQFTVQQCVWMICSYRKRPVLFCICNHPTVHYYKYYCQYFNVVSLPVCTVTQIEFWNI